MPILTVVGGILVKKVLIKGTLSVGSAILKEVSSNPATQHAAGKFAESMAEDAGKDLAQNTIDAIADGLEKISDAIPI